MLSSRTASRTGSYLRIAARIAAKTREGAWRCSAGVLHKYDGYDEKK